MFFSKQSQPFTLGALTMASGDSDCRKTDSLKATRGGETCSWMRAKRSFKSLITVSKCTSPGHRAMALCKSQRWTQKLERGARGTGGMGNSNPSVQSKGNISEQSVMLCSIANMTYHSCFFVRMRYSQY